MYACPFDVSSRGLVRLFTDFANQLSGASERPINLAPACQRREFQINAKCSLHAKDAESSKGSAAIAVHFSCESSSSLFR